MKSAREKVYIIAYSFEGTHYIPEVESRCSIWYVVVSLAAFANLQESGRQMWTENGRKTVGDLKGIPVKADQKYLAVSGQSVLVARSW